MSTGCCACAPPDSSDGISSSEASSFWIRFGISAVLAGQSMVFGLAINLSSPVFGSPAYWWLHGALILSSLIVIGLLGPQLFRQTWRAVRAGKITVEALFLVTCAGALAGSLLATFTGVGSVYYEVVAIVLAIYSIGKRTGSVSREKVLREIHQYRETFDTAREILATGEDRETRAAFIQPGASVRVGPGEPVPVDGIIIEGSGYIEQSQLTGEPVPVIGKPNTKVYAGSWSVDGTLVIESTKGYGDRRIDQILSWVEDAREKPSRLQHWADHAIQWFFPIVVGISIATFSGWFLFSGEWSVALFNSMAVLLVACPCALGLATPIAVWKGLFRLTGRGLLCRHGEAFDALATTRRIFFDKTGTLSGARLVVEKFQVLPSCTVSPEKLRDWIAAAEAGQEHPVARALSKLEVNPTTAVVDRRILPGRGIQASLRDESEDFLLEIGPADADPDHQNPGIIVRVNGIAVATIDVRESLRAEAVDCLKGLHQRGIAVEILSGDPHPIWDQIAGVEVEGSLSAGEKRSRVQAATERGDNPIFVGDGINDTPAMAAGLASISIGEGASLARGTSDAVLLGSNLQHLLDGIDLARKIYRGVHANIRFALVYNAIGISLAAAGILHPVAAALLMLASSATVSIRALLSAEFPQKP